jgi:hypothetical protein
MTNFQAIKQELKRGTILEAMILRLKRRKRKNELQIIK